MQKLIEYKGKLSLMSETCGSENYLYYLCVGGLFIMEALKKGLSVILSAAVALSLLTACGGGGGGDGGGSAEESVGSKTAYQEQQNAAEISAPSETTESDTYQKLPSSIDVKIKSTKEAAYADSRIASYLTSCVNGSYYMESTVWGYDHPTHVVNAKKGNQFYQKIDATSSTNLMMTWYNGTDFYDFEDTVAVVGKDDNADTTLLGSFYDGLRVPTAANSPKVKIGTAEIDGVEYDCEIADGGGFGYPDYSAMFCFDKGTTSLRYIVYTDNYRSYTHKIAIFQNTCSLNWDDLFPSNYPDAYDISYS